MIDQYCERLGPGLWAEPMNAISNLAFFAAAIALMSLCNEKCSLRKHGAWSGMILVILLFSIAVGSTLFHTFATAWARQLDVIPILLFQLMFLGAYIRVVMGLPKSWMILILGGFLLLGVGVSKANLPLNGSDAYLAPLIFLMLLAIYHRINIKSEANSLLTSAWLFTASITLRTVDNALCEQFPMGTHFVWHLLNAVVLYLCGRAYVLAARDKADGD